jgi:uncharacterized protein (TIGR02118 family)
MIRFSVYYPSGDDTTFDHDYYRDKHVPLAVSTWGLDGADIDKGVSGPYVAAVHFTFESNDALQKALSAEGTGAVMADIPNYTNATPVTQISEIVSS